MYCVQKVFQSLYPFYIHSLDCFQYVFVIYVGIVEKVTNSRHWHLGKHNEIPIAIITSSVKKNLQKYLQRNSDHAINHWPYQVDRL